MIAYYRVSTQQQGRSGLGLEAQQVAVEAYAANKALRIHATFTEVESGRCRYRPELARAVTMARGMRVPLVVAKLDRLARDTTFLLSLIDSGVMVVFLDLPELGADPITSRLILTVLAAIAEFEARRISQRIREAMARRKARGEKMGWQANGSKHPMELASPERRMNGTKAAKVANRRRAVAFRMAHEPVARSLRDKGLTLAAIASEMNTQGYRTRRGHEWNYATVDLLLRCEPCPAGWITL